MTRVAISRCLGIDACRYNGEIIKVGWLRELVSRVDVISVCPEIEIGLGIPRQPINLIECENGLKVIQSGAGIDLTEEMVSFSQGYLRFLKEPDAFIFKSKSPSCGLETTKVIQNDSHYLSSGIFASIAKECFPNAVFVDECFMEKNGVDSLISLINSKSGVETCH